MDAVSLTAVRDRIGSLKAYLDGTHRLVHPSVTVARVRAVAHELGITRVANITGLDRLGIPVVSVCRPNSRSVAVSMGKGLSLEAAMASGMMEAAEGYHAERVARPVLRSTLEELDAKRAVVDVWRLPALPDTSFRPDLPILWVAGTDLARGGERWVPYELVHTDYRKPLPEGSGCFTASSNGLASGNHPLEAILHGLCEVVERDCLVCWDEATPNECDARRVDLASVDDPACRELLGRFVGAGLSVGVWDITSEVGLPTFMCWLVEAGPAATAACPVSGQGCHLVREVALARALTEAAQARLTVITGVRDDLTLAEYDEAARASDGERWLEILEGCQGRRAVAAAPSWPSDSLEHDLDTALRRLERAGFREVVAVDLTLPEIDIPVARVIVPGLRVADD